jgi:hypothetical protein
MCGVVQEQCRTAVLHHGCWHCLSSVLLHGLHGYALGSVASVSAENNAALQRPAG